jgi:hypothetical protein
MVLRPRIELEILSYQDSVIPFNYESRVPEVPLTRDGTIITSLIGGRLHSLYNDRNSVVGDDGLEPPNAGIKIRCLTNLANPQQIGSDGRTRTYDKHRMKVLHWPLCYIAKMVGAAGIEPATHRLKVYCSPN